MNGPIAGNNHCYTETMLIEQTLQCPYCGERFPHSIDVTAGSLDYIEDCYACCRPITIRIKVAYDGDLEGIEIRREDE